MSRLAQIVMHLGCFAQISSLSLTFVLIALNEGPQFLHILFTACQESTLQWAMTVSVRYIPLLYV